MIKKETFYQIAKEYGTPSFLFDCDEVLTRVEQIKGILRDGQRNEPIRLCYSIKANPFLIPYLMPAVDFFEVCSPGELSICQHSHVPGEMIIYSGVNKQQEDITEAICYGAAILTAESIRQFELISQACIQLKQHVSVILRLSSKSQFGMDLSDIRFLLKEHAKCDSYITIQGIHYFAGTQRTKLKHQKEELEELQKIISDLRNETSYALPVFEYGPGLPYPYFKGDNFEDTLAPLKELAPTLSDVAAFSQLTVEMGRFLASSCGYYLTGVADLKRSCERNWCILDGGMNHVNYYGQMMGLKIPIIHHLPMNQSDFAALTRADSCEVEHTDKWALCGSLCTTNDVLVREYEMQELKLHDILVFSHLGAYSVTEGIALFLSRDMPKVFAYHNGKITLLRDTLETWEMNTNQKKEN